MTKLSERIPNTSFDQPVHEWRKKLRGWLKELAEYVEFIDRRDRLAYRDLRERTSETPQKVELEYEPQTYDEAIALCKSWRRYVDGTGRVQWITPDGVRMEDSYSIKDQCVDGFISWERDKWPELWKEMVEAKYRGYLCFYENEWKLNVQSIVHKDSTPGRVVCQAYIVFKGRVDWARRLSKDD